MILFLEEKQQKYGNSNKKYTFFQQVCFLVYRPTKDICLISKCRKILKVYFLIVCLGCWESINQFKKTVMMIKIEVVDQDLQDSIINSKKVQMMKRNKRFREAIHHKNLSFSWRIRINLVSTITAQVQQKIICILTEWIIQEDQYSLSNWWTEATNLNCFLIETKGIGYKILSIEVLNEYFYF